MLLSRSISNNFWFKVFLRVESIGHQTNNSLILRFSSIRAVLAEQFSCLCNRVGNQRLFVWKQLFRGSKSATANLGEAAKAERP